MPVLRAAVVQQAVQTRLVGEIDADLQLVDLREVLRHDGIGVEGPVGIGFAAQLRRHAFAVVNRGIRVVQPRQRLVVLVERPHRPRVGNGDRAPLAFQAGFEFHRQPVDPLPAAQDVALPRIARDLLVVEAIGQRGDLPLALLAQPPHVQTPADLVRQVSLEFGLQLLHADRVVFARVQVLGDKLPGHGQVAAGIRRIGDGLRKIGQRVGTQRVDESVVLDVGPESRTRVIPAGLGGLVVRSDERNVIGPHAVGAQVIQFPERRRIEVLVLADHGRRAVDVGGPPAAPQHGLVVEAP